MSATAYGQASMGEPALSAEHTNALTRWWPLALITVLAAVLRLATLGQQSLWFDEAYTPVHVFHASLLGTLHAVARTEDTPPLWYVLDWAISRVLGTDAVALRLLSALAGIATVPVTWAIARRLGGGQRVAIVAALLVAVNPLFVWYSQEARAYGLFVLCAAFALLCFLRALERPTTGRLAQFALCASLALLTHYFAVFLLAPMIVWLVYALLRLPRGAVGSGLPSSAEISARESASQLSRGAVGSGSAKGDASQTRAPRASTRPLAWQPLAWLSIPVLVGLALLPLVLAQTSHKHTQWIEALSMSSKLQAIPQYYLTGYSGAPLGHAIELLVALPAVAGVAFGLWRGLDGGERRGAWIVFVVLACGVLTPIVLALVGFDYLAPRNVIAAMIPLTALLAVVIAARRAGSIGLLLAGVLALGFLAVTIDVWHNPRLQRGDWAGLASVLHKAPPEHVVTTLHLGTAPLEYYLPSLRSLPAGQRSVTVREVDETGYPPLRPGAGQAPAGFRLAERRDIKGLLVYRFVSHVPVTISARALRADAIAAAHTEVLVPADR